MTIESRQVWNHNDLRSITQERNNLVTWIDFNWVTELEDIRSQLLTQYNVNYSAYSEPAVLTLTKAAGTPQDPAVYRIEGGLNDGDTVELQGSFTADGRVFGFGFTTTISGTSQSSQAAAQLSSAIDAQTGLAGGFVLPDEEDQYIADVQIYPDEPIGATDVTITLLTYTSSEPVIPTSPGTGP